MEDNRLNPDPSLEELVRELNQDDPSAAQDESTGVPDAAPAGAAQPSLSRNPALEPLALEPPRLRQVQSDSPLESLLQRMIERGATDLIMVPGARPAFRIDGQLVDEGGVIGDGDAILAMMQPYLNRATQERFVNDGAVDFSLRLAMSGSSSGVARFRINLHRQRGTAALAVRALPGRIPSLEELNLPVSLVKLMEPVRGLVLICGPTGSGKSTTVAALLDWLVRQRSIHVLTIEDPIEYELANHRSVIEQIEVGSDSPSFAHALRAALRQDPDVLFVGEMRDLETVSTALTAAETGHLVVATLHTNDVVQAIHRMVDVFPPAQQSQIRHQLALSLHAIVQQVLIPRADRPGRIPAVELLLANYPIRNHIRNDKLERIYNEITLGKSAGMVSLEASLAQLVRTGVVDPQEARIRTQREGELDALLGGQWS